MRSNVFYFDDDNNIVEKEFATYSIIQEFDDQGNFIRETIVREKNNPNSNFDQKYNNITGDDIDKMIHDSYAKMIAKLK